MSKRLVVLPEQPSTTVALPVLPLPRLLNRSMGMTTGFEGLRTCLGAKDSLGGRLSSRHGLGQRAVREGEPDVGELLQVVGNHANNALGVGRGFGGARLIQHRHRAGLALAAHNDAVLQGWRGRG